MHCFCCEVEVVSKLLRLFYCLTGNPQHLPCRTPPLHLVDECNLDHLLKRCGAF